MSENQRAGLDLSVYCSPALFGEVTDKEGSMDLGNALHGQWLPELEKHGFGVLHLAAGHEPITD